LASAKSAFIEKRADVWSSEVSVSIIDYRDANLLALRLFEPSCAERGDRVMWVHSGPQQQTTFLWPIK
jgi:hypothetical protein